jgi:hypothetical protein
MCLLCLIAPTAALADEPITLREIMQGLRDSLVTVTDGLLTDDFELVARGALEIAKHPQIPAEQVQRVAQELGPEMPAFKQFDTRVHDLSLELGSAAEAQDRSAAITAYQKIIDGCLACHATYKTRIAEILLNND